MRFYAGLAALRLEAAAEDMEALRAEAYSGDWKLPGKRVKSTYVD